MYSLCKRLLYQLNTDYLNRSMKCCKRYEDDKFSQIYLKRQKMLTLYCLKLYELLHYQIREHLMSQNYKYYFSLVISRQTRNVVPVYVYCWTIVYNAGPALFKLCTNAPCLSGCNRINCITIRIKITSACHIPLAPHDGVVASRYNAMGGNMTPIALVSTTMRK